MGKIDLMTNYVARAQETVRAWEELCKRCDDEMQQDLELRIELKSGGKLMGLVGWRWHPGLQRGVPLPGSGGAGPP